VNRIFISYRREDSEGFARGLFQSLANYFGKDSVFMDVDSISLGMDFVEAIDTSLDKNTDRFPWLPPPPTGHFPIFRYHNKGAT